MYAGCKIEAQITSTWVNIQKKIFPLDSIPPVTSRINLQKDYNCKVVVAEWLKS